MLLTDRDWFLLSVIGVFVTSTSLVSIDRTVECIVNQSGLAVGGPVLVSFVKFF